MLALTGEFVCSDHDVGMCAHVCTCQGNGDMSFSWALTGRPGFSRDVMNRAAGAVFAKVRHSSPRLMFSTPVGRFFFSNINPSATYIPQQPGNLLPGLFFFILSPGLGKLQFSDTPLKNCLVTWASLLCDLFMSWGLGIPEEMGNSMTVIPYVSSQLSGAKTLPRDSKRVRSGYKVRERCIIFLLTLHNAYFP